MNGTEPRLQPPVSLYLHVPFCVSLCPYCDFVVYSGASARGPQNRIALFVDALTQELMLRADGLDERFGEPGGPRRPPLNTLYFGGGTPSLLPEEALAGLLRVIRQRYGLSATAEVTIEANPGPDDRGDAHAFAALGITRISFGAQSLDDGELRRLGRRHHAADVGDAVAEARSAGIGSVNLDLLYEIPDQTLHSWASVLETALALQPDHLSLYALTLDDPDAEGLTGIVGDHLPVKRGARRWREDARRSQDDDAAAAMYQDAVALLAQGGWNGYEISNWARVGHESRHNLAYWRREPYEAVGPGAHAFDGRTRRWNAARFDAYVAALLPSSGSPRLPPGGWEALDDATAKSERTILGLRLAGGLPIDAIEEAPLADAFAWAMSQDLVAVETNRIRLTTRGRLLSNELFARLV